MTLAISKSKNSTTYYVKQSLYNDGKITSRIVERLGSYSELEERFGKQDTLQKARQYIKELTIRAKDEERIIAVKYSTGELIEKDRRRLFSIGYIFLQKIYHELGLHKICSTIADRHKFEYNLNTVMSRLIYGRILFPASKLATFELSQKLIEPLLFDLHHVYRSLDVIEEEMDFI